MTVEKSSAGQPKKIRLGIVRELYPLQNISGRKNSEVFAAVKLADESFKNIPAFIGAYPKGSLTQDYGDDKLRNKGYRLPYEPSDIDVVCIVDRDEPGWSRFSIADGIGVGAGLHAGSRPSHLNQLEAKARAQIGRPVQVFAEYFSMNELSQKVDQISARTTEGRNAAGSLHWFFGDMNVVPLYFSRMSRLMKGSRVDAYREKMRRALYTLPQDARIKIMEECAKELMQVDSHSKWKRAERLTGAVLPQLT